MRITILCSSEEHPINDHLEKFYKANRDFHDITIVRKKSELSGGDILFLISCYEIITIKDREKFNKSLVIHASDLPDGRGWSPHVWEVINGGVEIIVTLLEVEDIVDSGDIWEQIKIPIAPYFLYDEINKKLFDAEIKLISHAIDNFDTVTPYPQSSVVESTYYRKRTLEDSEIDVSTSIKEQFNLIRVCDPSRFPAFFELYGHRFELHLKRVKKNE